MLHRQIKTKADRRIERISAAGWEFNVRDNVSHPSNLVEGWVQIYDSINDPLYFIYYNVRDNVFENSSLSVPSRIPPRHFYVIRVLQKNNHTCLHNQQMNKSR